MTKNRDPGGMKCSGCVVPTWYVCVCAPWSGGGSWWGTESQQTPPTGAGRDFCVIIYALKCMNLSAHSGRDALDVYDSHFLGERFMWLSWIFQGTNSGADARRTPCEQTGVWDPDEAGVGIGTLPASRRAWVGHGNISIARRVIWMFFSLFVKSIVNPGFSGFSNAAPPDSSFWHK